MRVTYLSVTVKARGPKPMSCALQSMVQQAISRNRSLELEMEQQRTPRKCCTGPKTLARIARDACEVEGHILSGDQDKQMPRQANLLFIPEHARGCKGRDIVSEKQELPNTLRTLVPIQGLRPSHQVRLKVLIFRERYIDLMTCGFD